MAALLAACRAGARCALRQIGKRRVILICGRDETALEAGKLLKDHLDVTVLIEPPATIAPPRTTTFR